MRRTWRVFLALVTVGSLALCSATLVLWVRSHWVADEWTYTRVRRLPNGAEQRSYAAAIASGQLEVSIMTLFLGDAYLRELDFLPMQASTTFDHAVGDPERPRHTPAAGGPDVVVTHGKFGFEYGVTNPTPRTRDFLHTDWVAVPLWLVAACMALLPMTAWRSRRLRRRARNLGLCPDCGYDCRATPDRCPECGRTVTSTPPRAREGKGETEGV